MEATGTPRTSSRSTVKRVRSAIGSSTSASVTLPSRKSSSFPPNKEDPRFAGFSGLLTGTAGLLTPDGLDKAAGGLSRLKDMGVFHAIVSVHPRHAANAAPLFEAFASKHLEALQG